MMGLSSVRLRLDLFRIYQWVKNLLVLVPLLAAHQFSFDSKLQSTVLAFFAFCFVASSGYIINDLRDKDADALHPKKKFRPIAAKRVSELEALFWSIFLLSAAIYIASIASKDLILIIALYWLLTLAYSLFFKELVVVDVVLIALFYLLRIFGGSLAAEVVASAWLLAFTGFLFFSLGMAKRYAEIEKSELTDDLVLNRRDYMKIDGATIQTIGIVSSFASIILLAIYINAEETKNLYAYPSLLLFTLPFFLFWITKTWIVIGRGADVEDPVIFLVKDRDSWISALLIISVMLIAISGA